MQRLSKEDVGRAIEKARVAAGKTQAELAEHLGIAGGQTYISKVENGTKGLKAAALLKLAAFLGVPSSRFLVGGAEAENDSGSSADESERQALNAARRLVERFSVSWAAGHFDSEQQLAASLREIASPYPPVGREYVEWWIGSNLKGDDANEADNESVPDTASSREDL